MVGLALLDGLDAVQDLEDVEVFSLEIDSLPLEVVIDKLLLFPNRF